MFSPEKKQEIKKIAVARVAIILATRWTGNKLFFNGSLKGCAPNTDQVPGPGGSDRLYNNLHNLRELF